MTQIRWGIYWSFPDWCLHERFYEVMPFDEPEGILWSTEVAHDTIMNLGVLK